METLFTDSDNRKDVNAVCMLGIQKQTVDDHETKRYEANGGPSSELFLEAAGGQPVDRGDGFKQHMYDLQGHCGTRGRNSPILT